MERLQVKEDMVEEMMEVTDLCKAPMENISSIMMMEGERMEEETSGTTLDRMEKNQEEIGGFQGRHNKLDNHDTVSKNIHAGGHVGKVDEKIQMEIINISNEEDEKEGESKKENIKSSGGKMSVRGWKRVARSQGVCDNGEEENCGMVKRKASEVEGIITDEEGEESIWKLPVLSRFKVFLWRMCLDILPTVEALERRGMLIEDKCPWCNIENETGYHVLVECDILKQIWDNAPFNFNGRSYHGSVLEWMVVEWSEWSRDQRGCFAMSLYYIWEARNGKKFRGENPNLHDIWRRVERSWDELITAEESTMSNQNQPPNLKWIKPTDPFIKLNVDIALKQDGVGAVGGVFRDHEGLCVGAFSGKVPSMGDVTLMEALGMRKGIEVARDGGITHIIVESDSKLVVDMLHSPCTHESRLSAVCKSIIELCKQFSDCDIRWVPRVCNSSAHRMARLALNFNDDKVWPDSAPI
ncbi:ribonuclease H [Senna tora]|uniref:Ribonuclease H n=1 Tax=Senna tora TaxID=362788 RepID=A0A834WQE7_9FABA|nr:ribonuclease H [Senna tora]